MNRRPPDDHSGDLFAPPPTISSDLGRAGRDAGMQTAIEHADSIAPGWSDRAFELLVEHTRSRPPPFTSPQFRILATQRGLASPASNMAWGSIFHRARKAGLLVRDGFEQYGDATMHSQTITRWKVP